MGSYGIIDEVERLKRDKNVLMVELVKMRQKQSSMDRVVSELQSDLAVTNQRQQQMMSFLAKAVQNPSILQSLAHQAQERRSEQAQQAARLAASERARSDDDLTRLSEVFSVFFSAQCRRPPSHRNHFVR